MNRILQSDWFREREEFYDLARGQLNKADAVVCVMSKVLALCNVARLRPINFLPLICP